MIPTIDIPGQGQCLVADRSYRRGDILWRGRPLVSSIGSPELARELCSYCFSTSEVLLVCDACCIVRYCSSECHSKHWRDMHWLECGYLKTFPPSLACGDVLTTIRGLLHNRTWRRLDLWPLVSHTDEQITTNRDLDLILLAERISWCLKEESIPMIEDMFRKVLVNSIRYAEPLSPSLGTVFDPFLSKLNHSCRPNSYLIFDKGAVRLQALSDIKFGQPITISYFGAYMPFKYSQSQLKSKWYFDCTCERCNRLLQTTDQYLITSGDEIYHCCNRLVYPDIRGNHRCSCCKNDFASFEAIVEQSCRVLHGRVSTYEEIKTLIERIRTTRALPTNAGEPLKSLRMMATTLAPEDQKVEALLIALSVLKLPLKKCHLPDELFHIYGTADLACRVAWDSNLWTSNSPKRVGLESVELTYFSLYLFAYLMRETRFAGTDRMATIANSFEIVKDCMEILDAKWLVEMAMDLYNPWDQVTAEFQPLLDKVWCDTKIS